MNARWLKLLWANYTEWSLGLYFFKLNVHAWVVLVKLRALNLGLCPIVLARCYIMTAHGRLKVFVQLAISSHVIKLMNTWVPRNHRSEASDGFLEHARVVRVRVSWVGVHLDHPAAFHFGLLKNQVLRAHVRWGSYIWEVLKLILFPLLSLVLHVALRQRKHIVFPWYHWGLIPSGWLAERDLHSFFIFTSDGLAALDRRAKKVSVKVIVRCLAKI